MNLPNRLFSFAVLLCAATLPIPTIPGKNSLSAEDIAKIRNVHKQYEDTWLKGDATGVRSLFTDDCVLLPPHAAKPRLGQQGLNEFWFPPDAPPSEITKLIVTIEGIGGDGQVAYTLGHGRSGLDHRSRQQENRLFAQRNLPQRPPETTARPMENLPSYVGRRPPAALILCVPLPWDFA